MSDDLISRKSLIENLNKFAPEHYTALVNDLIIKEPAAFDKEKVIDKLVELRQREYSDSDEDLESIDGEEIYDEGRSQGRFEAYHNAIKIVEKGGRE